MHEKQTKNNQSLNREAQQRNSTVQYLLLNVRQPGKNLQMLLLPKTEKNPSTTAGFWLKFSFSQYYIQTTINNFWEDHHHPPL